MHERSKPILERCLVLVLLLTDILIPVLVLFFLVRELGTMVGFSSKEFVADEVFGQS